MHITKHFRIVFSLVKCCVAVVLVKVLVKMEGVYWGNFPLVCSFFLLEHIVGILAATPLFNLPLQQHLFDDDIGTGGLDME